VRLQEERTQFPLPRMEGTEPQVTRRCLGLQRMQHVVDLDEVLLGRLADVGRGRLDLVEPVHVAAVQRDRAATVHQQLRHGTGDTGGVSHPHRLGDPEAGHVRGLADQRPAVRGEREDAVEPAVDLRGT
jgi:hypothetical protein